MEATEKLIKPGAEALNALQPRRLGNPFSPHRPSSLLFVAACRGTEYKC